jgi:hypothetical protein
VLFGILQSPDSIPDPASEIVSMLLVVLDELLAAEAAASDRGMRLYISDPDLLH